MLNLFSYFPKGDGRHKKQLRDEKEQEQGPAATEDNAELKRSNQLQDEEQNNSSSAIEDNSEKTKGNQCKCQFHMHHTEKVIS